ncbi:FAD dependent oxidoreductase [Pelagophyceae sp. CCMP2097]|nr:FAD dependent oxidoreductase [Pelagophyceae sp. CCMP2097]
MALRVECCVVGGGVVGLAVARSLALRGAEVLLLEANAALGQGVSSRSSEVIHAGLYYHQTPLKQKLCIAGRDLLYDYCEARAVPFRRCGKLVVATSEAQMGALRQLEGRACAAGVAIELLGPGAVAALEPEVFCVGALHSPATGVVDSHALCAALRLDAERAGATVATRTRAVGGETCDSGTRVFCRDADGEESQVDCDYVVNAAGLAATRLADAFSPANGASWSAPKPRFAKGSYFALMGKPPFKRLIYPLPEAKLGGLGIHSTVDTAGRVKFGPDVEWLSDDVDVDDAGLYAVDEKKVHAFAASVRLYYPNLDVDCLQPDYAGVRPKLEAGAGPADFVLARPRKSIFHLLGIESPGLTAALALADHVADAIRPT